MLTRQDVRRHPCLLDVPHGGGVKRFALSGRVPAVRIPKLDLARWGGLAPSDSGPGRTPEVRSVSERTFHPAERLPPGTAAAGGLPVACGLPPRSAEPPRPPTGFESELSTADSITVCKRSIMPRTVAAALTQRLLTALILR